MTSIRLLQCSVCFALGVLVTAGYGHFLTKASDEEPRHVQSTSVSASDEVLAVRNGYQRQISDLTRALEASHSSATGPTSAAPSIAHPESLREFQSIVATVESQGQAIAKQKEDERFLAAGFSMQRVEWIRTRVKELQVEREHLARQGGIKDPRMAAAYLIDKDLDLQNEIGEEEYDRYRKAQGRSVGVVIGQVLPTSGALNAGLQPGDEIVSYDRHRVYNQSMMDSLINAEGSRGSVVIDVLRQGQKIQLLASSGPLGIVSDSPALVTFRNRIKAISTP